MTNATCSVPGCDRPVRARGWCNKHWQRWREHGDPEIVQTPHDGCSIEGCDRPHWGNGWCNLHYTRWRNHGDPLWEPPRHQNRGATCQAEEPCDNPAHTKGLCKNHYYRWRTHGVTGPVPGTSPAERLWANTDKNGPIPEHRPDLGPCWVPAGDFQEGTYGYIWVDGRNVGAHRLAYELEVRPIPGGLVIDHLCRNPPCRNPAHLEPVTDQVNILRGIGPAARNAVKTECDQGHEFTEANTYITPDGGRDCKACGVVRRRASRRRTRRRVAGESRDADAAPAVPLVLF